MAREPFGEGSSNERRAKEQFNRGQEIAKKEKPYGLSENLRVAREGASVAGDARKKIESKT